MGDSSMPRSDTEAIRKALTNPVEVARLLCLHVETKQRAGLLCRCPIHGNKSGSLSIRVGRDGLLQVKCHGCDLSGDVLSLLAGLEGSFKAGLERGARLIGEPIRPYEPPPEPPRMDPVAYYALAVQLLQAGRLDGRPWVRPVEEYLQKRGLLRAARDAGWAALPSLRPWGAETLISARLLRRADDGQLKRVWGEHRLLIPWRTLGGRVCAIQRRRIVEAEGPKYVLPWSPEYPFGVERLQNKAVLIVEGAVDAMAARLLGKGKVDVVGIPGIGGWQKAWGRLFIGRRVLVGLDRGKPDPRGVIQEDRVAAQIAMDCAGLEGEPSPEACSLCGAAVPWLCEACGRRRAPEGFDWGKLWEARQSNSVV